MIYKNRIIEINRGDTTKIPVSIIERDTQKLYQLLPNDHLYFGLVEPGQKWEDAIIRKRFDADDCIDYAVTIKLETEDTELLHAGIYYYQIKLEKAATNTESGTDEVSTIVPKTKFIIVE